MYKFSTSGRVLTFLFLIILFNILSTTVIAQQGGYVNSISVKQGDTLKFYISSSYNSFNIRITRFNTSTAAVTITDFNNIQGGARTVPPDAYMNGCGWPETFRFVVPDSWAPGMYRATFPIDAGTAGIIFFVRPRNPGSHANTLVVLNTNTWQAYNAYGGKSLYAPNHDSRAHKVSFLRPSTHQWGAYYFFAQEMKFAEWMYNSGRAFEYATDYDIHSDPSLPGKYKVVVIAGHGEYWSYQQRKHFENYINNGGKLMILSGNTCWWQVRFENNGNTLVCYKSRLLDPLTGSADSLVTVNWYAPPVNRPENTLTGLSFRNGGYVNNGSTLPASEGYGDYAALNTHHWVYNGTGLNDGDEYGTASAIVGNEVDGALFAWQGGFPRPAGGDQTPANYIILGRSPAISSDPAVVNENGLPGIFHTPSGGAVFNAASIRWINGLATDEIVRKITVNVLQRFISNSFPPDILSWYPHQTETKTINNETIYANKRAINVTEAGTVKFSVNAKDPQNRSINFRWMLNGSIVGNDSIYNYNPSSDSVSSLTAIVFNDRDSVKVSWLIRNQVNQQIPPVPVQVSPANNTSTSERTIQFTWNSSAGASFYDIQVAKDSLFTVTLVNQTTNNLNYVHTFPDSSAKYFWRVRAGNTSGTSSYSGVWNVTINIASAPPVPTLVSPANNTSTSQSIVEFKWNASSGASFYDLQVSRDSLFGTTIVNLRTDSLQYTYTFPDSTAKYFWRVRAGNNIGNSSYSTVWNFTKSAAAPAAVNLLLPAKNQKGLLSTITFQWNSSLGAQSYRLIIALDKQFKTIFHFDSLLTDTSKLIGGFAQKKNYWWKVGAENQAGITFSEVRQFSTGTFSKSEKLFGVKAFVINSGPTKTIRLSWNTTNEMPGDYYEIHESTSPDDYKVLQKIPGEGNGTASYSIDLPVFSTETRLQVIKFNEESVEILSAFAEMVTLNQYFLSQNYPNPFNPVTTVEYSLPFDSRVTIKLFTVTGEVVQIITEEVKQAGFYIQTIDGRNLASGVYLLSLEAASYNNLETFRSVKKLQLIK